MSAPRLDIGPRHPNVVAADAMARWWAEHVARSDVELGLMPRAGHLFTCDRALRQGPSFVGARIVECVEVAVNIEQGEPLAVDLDPTA